MSFICTKNEIYLKGPTAFLPKKRMTNEDVLNWAGLTTGMKARCDWILNTTGIIERYWVAEDEACSTLAIGAAELLLKQFSQEKKLIRQIILATISGDFPSPPTAPALQHHFGLENVGAFDIGAACSGFIVGLHTGAALCVASHDTQLVVAADVRSKYLNKQDLRTFSLFGDGAAAILVTRDRQGAHFRLTASQIEVDGSVSDVISIPGGGSKIPPHDPRCRENGFLTMRDGAALFVRAVSGTVDTAKKFLQHMEISTDTIDWLIPHQGNIHLVRAVAQGLGIPPEKTIETIQYHGNTSGSTVGIALSQLFSQKTLTSGQKILLCAAGGGGIAAHALLEVC